MGKGKKPGGKRERVALCGEGVAVLVSPERARWEGGDFREGRNGSNARH